MPLPIGASIQVNEERGRFHLIVTYGGQQYDKGHFPSREAANAAGEQFIRQLEQQQAARRQRRDRGWDR